MLNESVVWVVYELVIPPIVNVNFYPPCSKLEFIDPNVITRFVVALHVNDEFMFEGLLKADNVALHDPLEMDNWLGKVIKIRLFVPKGFERFIEKV